MSVSLFVSTKLQNDLSEGLRLLRITKMCLQECYILKIHNKILLNPRLQIGSKKFEASFF